MTLSSSCLLFSANAEWVARMKAHLAPSVTPRPVDSPARVQEELEHQQDRVLLLDLLSPESFTLLPLVLRKYPRTLIIVFGLPGSDPMIQAEQWEVYAAESDTVDRARLIHLVQRALHHLELASENHLLRQETLRLNAITETFQSRTAPEAPPSLNLRDFSAALRHFTHVDTLLHRFVDEVANAMRVSRIGIFSRTRDIASYRLRAGLRCLESTSSLEYGETHPFVLWLTVHTHAVTRAHLDHIREVTARVMLQDMLDQMGAEVLIPLQSHNRLLGWIFVGHLSTGLPLDKHHLDNLISLTECVSTTLENALLYEEVTIQKTLAETLLHSLPSGIIAVDDAGIVRWYNESAQTLFGIGADTAIGRPVEGLGSRLADLLRGTLGESGAALSAEWLEPLTRRLLSTRTRRLVTQTRCLGAVAFVQDITDQKSRQEQLDRQDRAAFWTELAASLSHEVRNPLVAIKTFAQLLPERYGDKEFQTEFKDLVSSEVERLNGIVDQIHAFAHPPSITFKPFSLKSCLDACVARVIPADAPLKPRVSLSFPDAPLEMSGDEKALGEAFMHILQNSVEALAASPQGEITISVTPDSSAPRDGVVIAFKDNGPGIRPELLDKIFTPFSTTKARGLGLGLPIARRTLLDHRGTITIHSNELGVLVTIRLPMHPGECGS